MPTLYVVATPIGNLKDITLRAIEVLKSVDFVVCEDTRVTSKLLQSQNISVKTLSFHAHSGEMKIDHIIELLREGKSLALVTDAGTPAISDPGSFLVQEVRKELGNSVNIVSVPGPSAVVAALSISGIPSSEFLFLGFLPHKKGRKTLFEEIASNARPVVFYESPHRILKTIESLKMVCPKKKVVLAREITKMFEETIEGLPEEIEKFFADNPEKVRGEFVVIVY